MSCEIGNGAYSKVYRKKVKGQWRALKIVEIDEEIVKSSARELHAMCQLKHHNAHVSLEQSYMHKSVDGDTINILMECADTNLYEFLKRNTCSPERKVKWTIQLVNGLFEMHAKKLYHRDIKPDNVLVKGDNVYYCDYGLTRQFSSDCTYGTAYVVTRWWRAPELLKNKRGTSAVYTQKMDVWSLGVVLYEMIFNKAFAHVSSEDAMFAIEKQIQKLRDDCQSLDTRLQKVLLGCLVKDPKDRFNIVDCMHALELITSEKHASLNEKIQGTGVLTKITTPLQPARDEYRMLDWEKRWIYFHELDRETKLNKSIKAHTLLLYDKSKSAQSHVKFSSRIRFILSLIVSCCIYGTGKESVIQKYLELYKDEVYPFLENDERWPLISLSEFICTTELGELTQWENGEYDWYEYVFEATMNPFKRLRRV